MSIFLEVIWIFKSELSETEPIQNYVTNLGGFWNTDTLSSPCGLVSANSILLSAQASKDFSALRTYHQTSRLFLSGCASGSLRHVGNYSLVKCCRTYLRISPQIEIRTQWILEEYHVIWADSISASSNSCECSSEVLCASVPVKYFVRVF
jgi:hypothetical protein